MKAVVFQDIGDIRLDNVPDPTLQTPTDIIIELTASAICGTDLHMIRGTMPGMVPGTILGHEGVGIVTEVGADVRNLRPGDRVVIPSTIACGYCSYCRSGYHSQCDNANPNGMRAGTAFFGGPQSTGPFQGLQAEYARIPFGHVGAVKLPEEIDDDQAILMSDIFPTGYFGAQLAEIRHGDTVVVFGCGPVGQFAIVSAQLMGASRVLAVDHEPTRLQAAQGHGAEAIDFSKEDPVGAVLRLTGGIGADRAIDAVGIDAQTRGTSPSGGGSLWQPGDGPSEALKWAVDALAKAGTLSIIGVYPQTHENFPIGKAMNRNLTMKMGNCNHRAIIPELVDLVRGGVIDPADVLTQTEDLTDAISAYKAFDQRQPGWMKVKLEA
ncbi:zinc-dependent alcohol dehydrogenase [Paracidovorax citrulli]